MPHSLVRRALAAASAAVLLSFVPAFARAQEPKSPALAKELAQLLDAKKLDSIAAADPANLGTYVAALYFPGSQLLLVSAKYAAPPLLNEKIAKKDYREVYIDLSSASVAGSKLFVMDANADGLVSKPGEDQPFDSAERAGTQYTFDGQWKKAKISEADYQKNFGDIDEAYAKALRLLIAQLKNAS
jgi:hypothetical protein